MATLVKIHRNGQITLPSDLRSKAGMAEGDIVEATVRSGRIVLTPSAPIARSRRSSLDDEYTAKQRRIIDEQLDEAEKGPFRGPFNSTEVMIADLKGELKKRAALKKRKRGR